MKSVDEIYEQLLGTFETRCGWKPEESCDLAVRLYAMAAQLQALHIQADWVLDQSFPQTAQGVYLDRHAAMRGLVRAEAAKAVGVLRLSVGTALGADLDIPKGVVCMTEGEIRFQTTEAGTLPAGSRYVDIPAEAVEAGTAGNAAAGTVRLLTACPVSVTACTNPAAFSGGRDPEEDESLRQRVLESYQRLPNGANAAWYERTAMSHAGVAAARAVGRARGIGTVDVYIATEAGLPGAALLAEIQADLQEKREIAVALAPEAAAVDVSLSVAAENGEFTAVKGQVEQAVTDFFSGRLLGKPVRLVELSSLIYSLEGVENVRVLAPTSDIAASDGKLPMLGSLTVTEWETRVHV